MSMSRSMFVIADQQKHDRFLLEKAYKIANWVEDICEQKHFDLVVKTGHRTESLFHTPTDRQLIRQLSCLLLIGNTAENVFHPFAYRHPDCRSQQTLNSKSTFAIKIT